MERVKKADKFKELYYQKYKKMLTDEEATQMATDLINLVYVLIKPNPESKQIVPATTERRDNALISLQSY
jgi:hypothetical protein